jgi:hypothetical protein
MSNPTQITKAEEHYLLEKLRKELIHEHKQYNFTAPKKYFDNLLQEKYELYLLRKLDEFRTYQLNISRSCKREYFTHHTPYVF